MRIAIASRRRQQGLSLIELMIAITLGLLVLAGLTTVFVTASESQRELQRSAQQIESQPPGIFPPIFFREIEFALLPEMK